MRGMVGGKPCEPGSSSLVVSRQLIPARCFAAAGTTECRLHGACGGLPGPTAKWASHIGADAPMDVRVLPHTQRQRDGEAASFAFAAVSRSGWVRPRVFPLTASWRLSRLAASRGRDDTQA